MRAASFSLASALVLVAPLVVGDTPLRAQSSTPIVASTLAGQRIDTVTVEQRVLMSPDLTPAEARRRALDNALADAVRQVAGVRVQSSSLSILDEHGSAIRDGYSSVVQLDAAARATDYRVLGEEWESVRHPQIGLQLYLRTRTWVVVEREHGSPDPAFSVEVTLNATLFTARGGQASASDEVIAAVRASQDAFLTLFVIADDSAERIFPNEYVPRVGITADSRIELPDPDWRARGVRLRASLPEGRAARRELLMVVATRTAIPPPPSMRLSIMGVQRWLVRIPADQRAVGFAAYEVRRGG